MFVAVARITLSIPESGSLKGKRQVLRRVVDRVKARFNVSIAEVGDHELWQKAVLGIAAVANDSAFAQESVDKVVRFVEEMYVAPVISRETEVIPMGGELYAAPLVARPAPRRLRFLFLLLLLYFLLPLLLLCLLPLLLHHLA
ncbi:MAG: DUF503 domain-containing protein, partial [Myxococcales bacterium]